MIAYQGAWEACTPMSLKGPPHRGQGKRKLHLFHMEPCTSHAFFAFFVDGQSQLGQLKSTLTIQHQEPDLWEYFPMLMLYYSSFETSPTLKFSWICFIQTSDEHALFSFWVHSQAWIWPCFWHKHHLNLCMWLGQFEMIGWWNMRG